MGCGDFRDGTWRVRAGCAWVGAAALIATSAGETRAQLDVSADVIYHIMPIAWRDSDGDTHRFGDFGGMIDSLDYLEDLGVTGVWMNPIFPSPAYHGYQHGRADQLNPWFGSEGEWIAFVEAAHARGIKVFLDFVVYGISHDSPWFQSAYSNPGSQYDDWLAFTNGSNTNYLGSTYPTWNGSTVGFIHWDLRTPDVAQMVQDWGRKWLDPNEDGDFSDGVDGYRLDHVWEFYPNGPDGWGYNIDDFWIPWKAALQQVNPDVFIFAEQADWGSMGVELLPAFDASMTKPFEFAARDAVANEASAPLYGAMATATAAVPDGRTFMGIIGDHDVDRLASVIGPGFAKGKVAAAVLMSQPFTPMIYFGDEIGMLGVKANFGGDANDIPMREPFKWNAVAGPPMSNYWALHAPAFNNAYSQDNDGRSVEEQDGVAGSLLETYTTLIATRKASEALTRGAYFPVPAPDPGVWAFVRQSESQTVLVVINLTGVQKTLFLDLTQFEITGGITTPHDLITGWEPRDIKDSNKDRWPLVIQPYTSGYFEVGFETYVPPPSAADGRGIPTDFAPESGLLRRQLGGAEPALRRVRRGRAAHRHHRQSARLQRRRRRRHARHGAWGAERARLRGLFAAAARARFVHRRGARPRLPARHDDLRQRALGHDLRGSVHPPHGWRRHEDLSRHGRRQLGRRHAHRRRQPRRDGVRVR
jgi:glycosidase